MATKKNGSGNGGERAERVHRILSKERRPLPVILNDTERLEKGKQIGALGYEIESIDAQIEGLKSQAKGLQATRDSKDAELHQLARIVRAGQEDRQVEVVIEADMRTGTVREMRSDTGEVLRERAMTREESQAELFRDVGRGAAPETPAEPSEEIDVTPPKALPPPRRRPPSGEDRA